LTITEIVLLLYNQQYNMKNMKKYLFISLSMLVSFLVNAQEKAKYLEGAVPEVNGKVVFTKSIKVNSPVSEANLLDLMQKWAEENYKVRTGKDLVGKVLLVDEEGKNIACSGEEYLVFKSTALILDRAKMTYKLIISIEQDKCNLAIRNIWYEYSDSKNSVPAEKMITDKMALNKKKDKLNRYYDKFRRYTVDSVDAIFQRVEVYLNGIVKAGAVSAVVEKTPVADAVQAPAVNTATNLTGFKRVEAGKIPANMQSNKALLLSGTIDKPSAIPVLWGGTTTLLDKQMALSTVNTSENSATEIENAQTYTITFYTEAYADGLKEFDNAKGGVKDKIKAAGFTPVTTSSGAPAFSEAWMIIECRKAGEMPSTDAKSASEKTYLGEILNVWIK